MPCRCTTGRGAHCGCRRSGAHCAAACKCVATRCTNVRAAPAPPASTSGGRSTGGKAGGGNTSGRASAAAFACGCRGDCSTNACGCQKRGVSCERKQCRCDGRRCTNNWRKDRSTLESFTHNNRGAKLVTQAMLERAREAARTELRERCAAIHQRVRQEFGADAYVDYAKAERLLGTAKLLRSGFSKGVLANNDGSRIRVNALATATTSTLTATLVHEATHSVIKHGHMRGRPGNPLADRSADGRREHRVHRALGDRVIDSSSDDDSSSSYSTYSSSRSTSDS